MIDITAGLRRYKAINQMSDEEMGDLLGASQSSVSRWVRGPDLPSPEYHAAVAQLLGHSVEEVQEAYDATAPRARRRRPKGGVEVLQEEMVGLRRNFEDSVAFANERLANAAAEREHLQSQIDQILRTQRTMLDNLEEMLEGLRVLIRAAEANQQQNDGQQDPGRATVHKIKE